MELFLLKTVENGEEKRHILSLVKQIAMQSLLLI